MLLQRAAINIIIYMIAEYEVSFLCVCVCVCIKGENIGLSCKNKKTL